MADAVTDQDLHSDPGILLLCVGVVNKSAGDAVGHLVRVLGIDFFVHILSPPKM